MELRDKCLFNFEVLNKAIQNENIRQLKKWGIQEHDIFAWITFAFEEGGETAAAAGEMVFRNGSRQDVFNEAIQAATLFLKIAEMVLPNE